MNPLLNNASALNAKGISLLALGCEVEALRMFKEALALVSMVAAQEDERYDPNPLPGAVGILVYAFELSQSHKETHLVHKAFHVDCSALLPGTPPNFTAEISCAVTFNLALAYHQLAITGKAGERAWEKASTLYQLCIDLVAGVGATAGSSSLGVALVAMNNRALVLSALARYNEAFALYQELAQSFGTLDVLPPVLEQDDMANMALNAMIGSTRVHAGAA